MGFLMKKLLMAAVVVISSLQVPAVFASADSPFFVGISVGDTTLNTRARSHIEDYPVAPRDLNFRADDSQTYSLLINGGYLFTENWGIEGVILTSLMPDKIFGIVKVNNEPESEFNSKTTALGIYAVYKAGSEFYAKGKVGLANSQVNFDADFASESFATAGLSFGGAVGQKLGKLGSIELSYMRYPTIKVDKAKFNQSFTSTPAYNNGISISRSLAFQSITVGYIFEF